MLLVGLFVLLCAGLAACSNRDNGGSGDGPGPTVTRPSPTGEARSLLLGLGAIPPVRTSDAYIDTFATAARYADAIVIRRTPPWQDFLPGASVSKTTADTTELETGLLKQYSNLQLVYAIDPTDPSVERSRIANLPAGVDPAKGFADSRIQSALKGYVTYVVSNYHPEYLAIGVEINMLYERNRVQFNDFVTLYDQLYQVAKAAQPNIQVFPTFQLEDLLGATGDVHPPHWEVLNAFMGKMDAFAFSTYPYLGGIQSAASLPENYYAQVKDHWQGPILITSAGYPSAPVSGQAVVGTEQDQQAFLNRLLGDAEKNGFCLVSWEAALDPSYAVTGTNTAFKDTGLRRSDGANKLAWTAWEQWARRPIRTSKG
jgi:hypothetical protein